MGKLKIGCLTVIGLFVLLGIIGAIVGGGSDKSSNTSSSTSKQVEQKVEKPKEYTPVDVGTLMTDLENNAAAAQKKYKNKDVKITGKLGNIDSDMTYINVQDANDPYAIRGVQCYLKKNDKAQEDFVLNLKKDQMVTVSGTMTDVGEVLGYSLKIDKFE